MRPESVGTVWGLALAALLTCAGPTAAQDGVAGAGEDGFAAAERAGLELALGAVLLTPLNNLTEASDTTGALQMSTGLGARGSAVWWMSRRLAVGLSAAWIPAEMDRLPTGSGDGDSADRGGKVADVGYLAGTAEVTLALPPVGRGFGVEPYLVAGVGVRRIATTGQDDGPDEAADPVVALGGGFRTLLSETMLLRLEVRHQVSRGDFGSGARVLHDPTVSVGIGVRP